MANYTLDFTVAYNFEAENDEDAQVLADDVMAGIYANICLQIIVRIFPIVVVR